MMRYILLICLSLFVSCDFLNQKNAVKYNDIIINSQLAIGKRFTEIGNAFIVRDSAQIYRCKEALNNTVDSALAVVEEMSSLDGSTELKDAAIRLFKYYKTINQGKYQEIITIILLPFPSEADVERLEVLKTEIAVEEEPLDKDLELAQKHMSEKYGFRVEKQDNP